MSDFEPGCTTWTIYQGRKFTKTYQLVVNGIAVTLAPFTDIVAEIRTGKVDDGGTLIKRMTLGAEITKTSTVQAATAVTTAFAADGVIVASAAVFLDELGQPTAYARETGSDGSTLPGDDAVLDSTTTNDGTHEILSVDSATQITVDTTFNAEAAAGTVAVSRVGEFVITLTDAETDALDFQNSDTATAEVYLESATQKVPFLNVDVTFVKKGAE